MFRVPIFINDVAIAELWAINTGHVNEKGQHLYRFRQPPCLNDVEVYHYRDKGWGPLLQKLMVAFNKRLKARKNQRMFTECDDCEHPACIIEDLSKWNE